MNDAISIPGKWAWATFGDIADIASDLVDPTATPDAIHIAPNHIESWTGKLLPFTTVAADGVTSPKQRFHAGQILYSKIRPYLAKAAFASFEGLCSADMYPVEAKIEPRFLLHWLLTPWFTGETARNQGRTILPKINRDALNRMSVPVAPLNEQKRIAEKIDELFSDLDAGVASLLRIRAKLKRYRAAVLKAAVEGKLTADWRAKHPNVEPAADLLKRILAVRRRKWEEAQLAKYTEAGKEPPNVWQQRYQETIDIDSQSLPKLPRGWGWAKVDQVGEVQLGRQRSPKHHTGTHMRPYLRVANVYEDRIETSDVMKMNFTPAEFETFRLEYGDILLNEGQSLEWVGRPAMYRGDVPGACFQNTLVRFRAIPPVVPLFALYVFRAYLHNRRFQKLARWTVNIAHLGCDRFCQVEFPLPPVEEQAEIVKEIEARLTIVDKIEKQVVANVRRAARLRQSILKRAFEGKLVPQVATDEPASALLERIRRQREQAAESPAGANGKAPSTKRKDTREGFFRRGAVVTYIVKRLSSDPSFGRTKLEKILHLTQTHLSFPLDLEFKRHAAGPFDEVIYKLEGAAKKNGWFETRSRPRYGVTYHPGPKADDLSQRAVAYLGETQSGLDQLLDHLAKMNTDQAELLATTYAAWNDLLIDGRPADEDAIIAEVYGWDESKKKFSRPQIIKCIAWMNKQGYVPTGQGQRTTVLEKKSKLRSKRKQKSG